MAVQFALNHFGAKFQAKLVDCISDDNIDVSDVAEQKIVFYKPDGTILEKTATLIEEPVSSGNFFVTYINTAPETESILDLRGKWEYDPSVLLNNSDSFETNQRFVFWVT